MRIANEPASESAPGTHRPEERPLYEPPRLRTAEEGARPTAWLEFFFDLVFVVAVDQLARRLEHSVTGHGTLVYFALYAPVWWAWVGFVLYTDRFGTDDISDRLLTLVQIGAVLVIAATALHATSDRAVAFALAYGAFRLVLAIRYAMAAHYVREVRKECARQSSGFAFAGVLWLASAAVPAPWRFWMWGLGFAIDLLTPFASPRMHHIVPPDPDHIEERFGTFINISLGEGFVGLVESMRDQPWSGAVLATAGLSLLVGFSIWWGFFDSLDQAPIAEVGERHRTGPYKIWIFAHLPLAAGVAATGIAVGNLTHEAHAGELEDSLRWLVCAMVALCYAAHAIVHIAYAKAGAGRRAWIIGARKMLTIAAALLLGAAGAGLSAVSVAGVLACAAGVQVLWNIWDRARAGEGADPGPGLAGARPST
ncbi:MAG: low temperature requirement protein A [Acidobacteria bacterium]|nr:low temperature requirement protein A [Acidobacteriota bacterium]MBV9476031.1 low temperature requirement protein A [Acidobacteriota bacterium]